MVDREATESVRMIYGGEHVAAFMPICARYSYEVWIAPRRAAPSFAALTRDEREVDLSRASGGGSRQTHLRPQPADRRRRLPLHRGDGRGLRALQRRGVGAKARPVEKAPAAAPKPASAPAASASKRKLSFNEKHALETLPKKIEALQVEAAKLNAAVAGDLYTRDPKLFAKATTRLDEVTREIGEAEERWLELEMLREEIGA